MPTIISSSFYQDGGSVTLLGTGSNRCVVAIPLARSGAISTLSSLTLNAVEAVIHSDIGYNGGGQKLISGAGYWLGGDDPGAGNFVVSQTWPGGSNNSCGLVIELTGVDQGAPLGALGFTGVGNQLNPVSVSHTLSSEIGEFAIAFSAFVDDSFSNASGFITSLDGHTIVSDDLNGNVRLGVFSDAVVASNSELYSFQTSQRGDTVLNTDSTIAAAFVVNGVDVTAPILTLPTGVVTSETTADGTVTTDEGNGTLYYYTSTNAVETAATIKSSGSSQTVSASGIQNVSITGLTGGLTYFPHYVHDDASLNESNVATGSSFNTPVPTIKIDSISPATIRAGDTVTLNISDASGSGYTLSTSAGAITIVTESSSVVTFIAPNPISFGDKTLTFDQAITLTLTDGGDDDTVPMTISIPATEVTFGQITEINPNGVYANDPDIEVGDSVYFERLTGDVFFDVGTGLGMNGVESTAQYAAYDTDWSEFVNVFYPAPGLSPVFTGNISNQGNNVNDTVSFNIAPNWSNSPTSFAVTTGSLPSGLSLDNTGLISGTTTSVQALSGIIVTATNDSGSAASNAFNWDVVTPLAVPVFTGNIANQSNDLNTVINLDISSNWTNSPTSFAVTSGSLPSGLSLSNAGVITGTVDTSQSLTGIMVTASNNSGSDVSNAFTWDVSAVATSPNMVVTGVVDISENPVTRTYEQWYLTDSNINASNQQGQTINIVAAGVDLAVVNGGVTVSVPGATIGSNYTLVAWVVGASLNASEFYIRDVSVTIVAGS